MSDHILCSRKEAISKSLTQYFTGEACRNGHVSPRNTKKGKCISCLREKQSRRREKNPDEDAAIAARYRSKNLEKVRANDRIRYENNIAKRKSVVSAWNFRNPEKRAGYRISRKASTKKATPSWLNDAQKLAMKEIYQKARRMTDETGNPHHVDHIHPLRGRGICGLHVPWNLQVITAKENQSKSNSLRFDNSLHS